MSTHQTFALLAVIVTLGLQISSLSGFESGVATWYGPPEGAGSTGGACGYKDDVTKLPYNSLISAGGPSLYRGGAGCGACYQVKCTENPACSGFPTTITITDECPGCTDAAIHFDLSGKAMGFLAKPGQAGVLRNAGKINIQYQRVPCNYNAKVSFRIDNGANPNYMAFEIEFVNGDGEIGNVNLLPSGFKSYVPMQRVFGETWKANLNNGVLGPFSVQLFTTGGKQFYADKVIPFNWTPGSYYTANGNIH